MLTASFPTRSLMFQEFIFSTLSSIQSILRAKVSTLLSIDSIFELRWVTLTSMLSNLLLRNDVCVKIWKFIFYRIKFIFTFDIKLFHIFPDRM